MKNTLIVMAFLLVAYFSFSQVTYEDNNPNNNNPLGYLGWNDAQNINLNILQNNLLRMRFTSIPYAPVGGIPDGQTQNYTSASRILLDVQGAGNPNAVNPYSMLHLHGSSSVSGLQRNWMHVGTTYTDEGDICYVGLQQQPDVGNQDRLVDAVIAWGCNEGGNFGPDNMRFVFIRPLVAGSQLPAQQQLGLEVARFSPQGNFGIGNFSANGLNVQPTQRLDVQGNGRFRNIPAGAPTALITGIQNGSNPNDLTFRRLNFNGNANTFLAGNGTWVNASSLCDWNIVNNGDDLAMGFGPEACVEGNVGIGLIPPGDARLDITKFVNQNNFDEEMGERIRLVSGDFTGSLVGLRVGATSDFAAARTVGTVSNATGGEITRGIEAHSEGGLNSAGGVFLGTGGENATVSGVIATGENFDGQRVYGVAGFARGGQTETVAGDFVAGNVEDQVPLAIGVRGVARNGEQSFGGDFEAGIDEDQVQLATGVRGVARNGEQSYGGDFEAGNDEDQVPLAIGVRGVARNGNNSYGGLFNGGTVEQSSQIAVGSISVGRNTGSSNWTIGAYARARNTTCQGNVRMAALYGTTTSNQPDPDYCPGNQNAFALLLHGQSGFTNSPLMLSDASLKTDIEDISDATTILKMLKPKSYLFTDFASESLGTGNSTEFGFLAQDIEEILPELVGSIPGPINQDEDGNLIGSDETYKGIRYIEFIPILVAGFQEQQSTIEDQNTKLEEQAAELEGLKEQINTLFELVAACCEAGGAKSFNAPHPNEEPGQDMMNYDLRIEQPYLGQNVPNPFMNETSITYRIPEQAMVRVRVMDAKGQQVDMLVDGLMPKGEYRIVWNASHLPSGLYFYTLEADGVELVKKAVKL